MANLALMRPRGLVPGFVANYPMNRRNLLSYSEDFSKFASWNRADSTVLNNVVTITNSGSGLIVQEVKAMPLTKYIFSFEFSEVTPNLLPKYSIRSYNGSAFTDIIAPTTYHPTPDRGKITVEFTTLADTQVFYVYPVRGTGIVGDVQLYNAHVQLEVVGDKTYQKTTDNQTLTNYSGYSHNGQLGSTVGIDTNDPTFDGQKFIFSADDYIPLTGNFDMSKFSILAVYSADNGNQVSLLASDTAQGIRLDLNAGKIGLVQSGVDTIAWGNSTVAQGEKSFAAATYSVDTGNYVFYRNGVRDNSGTRINSPIPLTTYTIGARRDITPTQFFSGALLYLLIYPRVISDAEILRNYNYLKRELAKRGVQIA